MKFSKFKGLFAMMLVSIIFVSNITTSATTTNSDTKTSLDVKSKDRSLDRKLIGYFPEWAYKDKSHANFDVADLQWDDLTHIQYSFSFVDEVTNKITFGDQFAAVEEDFKDYPMTHKGQEIKIDPSLPYKGHFNILTQMKKKYPDVKVVMSIGGWAGSRGFYTMMDTEAGMETFADSCVDFVRKYGFDGVDIDFEFPSSTSQSGNPADFDVSEPRRATINASYNKMMKLLRKKLDAASAEDNKTGYDKYVLSAAVSASSWVLGGVPDNSYAKELDFLSVMSYDYHGGWNEFVENQANIYGDPADNETKGMALPVLGMDWTYNYYRGVLPPEKIIMGIPYYTRGWENVSGGDGTGLHGLSKTPATGKYNIWGDDDVFGHKIPAGANPLWHVMNLMDQDANLKRYWDNVGKVPHLWNAQEKVFLSFEDTQSIDERLKFIEEKNLGGALIWVMNGDYAPNPNYVKGSTDINEGKYTFGNTLTKRLIDGFKSMGPSTVTNEELGGEKIDVDVKFGGKYDHPNYTYELDITNNTGKEIAPGWKVAFDLPKSAIFKGTWGGTVTEKDNGDFKNITITGAGWQSIRPGEKVTVSGMISLCFSDVRNITFNGQRVSGPSEPVYLEEDVNKDGKIDILDLGKVASKYNILTGKPGFDTVCDITKDGAIDISDLVRVAKKIGSSITEPNPEPTPDPEEPNVPGDAWIVGKSYKLGDVVSKNGKRYECINPHVSADHWSPELANTLWKLL